MILFVVDSADLANIDQAKIQLFQLISWPSLAEIPLLVLGNKNDIEGCLNEEEMIEKIELNHIKNRKVACFSISAKENNNIQTMLKWLTGLQKLKKKKEL